MVVINRITSLIILLFLCAVGCTNGRGMKVTIMPALDKRLKEVHSIPVHVGVFIEPSLRQLSQEERQTDMIVGIHHYVFPIGEPLAKNIEEMTKTVFNKVTILNGLPSHEIVEKDELGGVLTVRLRESKLELIVEDSVWRAIGKHDLSIQASFLDKNLNTIFDEELTVEGKNLDVIDFETEGGWWKTAGPKYGPAVEDAIEKIVFLLAQKLLVSRKPLINK